MNQRAQSARGDSGSHYFWGVQVFTRQTETRVETDRYIRWHLQLQLRVNMGGLPEERCPQMPHWSVWVEPLYNRWDDNFEFVTTKFSNHTIKFRSSSSFSSGWWWWWGNECDIKFAELTVGYIVTMTNPQYWDPWGQYRGQRATKLLAVHFKLSSNSNPSFQLLSQ